MSTNDRRHRLHDHSDDNSGGRIAAQHVTGLSPAATGTTSTSSGGAAVLDDLGDVDLVTTPPVDNDGLTYDSASGKWVPTPVEQAIEGGQSVIKAHGSMGSTETFDPTDGNVHTGTLNANCTFTLNAPTGSGACTLELRLTQDGTGGWVITWPGSVAVIGTLDTTASTESIVIVETLDGGSTWVAVVVGSGGSSVGALDDLSDVTITTPTAADRLRYNGSVWVNSPAIWVPVMVEDGATGLWYVVVTGVGDAVMTEVS